MGRWNSYGFPERKGRPVIHELLQPEVVGRSARAAWFLAHWPNAFSWTRAFLE